MGKSIQKKEYTNVYKGKDLYSLKERHTRRRLERKREKDRERDIKKHKYRKGN
jgi:hypothetical protein